MVREKSDLNRQSPVYHLLCIHSLYRLVPSHVMPVRYVVLEYSSRLASVVLDKEIE